MTRVRITDPALVPLKYVGRTVPFTGGQAIAISSAAIVARQSLKDVGDIGEAVYIDLQGALKAMANADPQPDLDAIAAAFERGEEVAGAELEDA